MPELVDYVLFPYPLSVYAHNAFSLRQYNVILVILHEDSSNQLLYYNRVIEPEEIIEKINSVTNKTVEKVAKSILTTPMTIASIGPIKKLESLDKIQSRLK